MTVHHIISETDLKDVCPYCGRHNASMLWNSTFDNNVLYKELNCSCGRKVSVKMPFIGSGHDSWQKSIDKKVEEADAEFRKK